MYMSRQDSQYKALGSELKSLRERQKKTLAEVSGAVEIESESLVRMEQGLERPSEDILMLLINHFDINEKQALQLWELAGYDQPPVEHQFNVPDIKNGKQMLMLLAIDARTMYSDSIEVTAGPNGVVMNFTQVAGQQSAVPVAKVGMSVEQAKTVLQVLEQAMLRAQYLNGPRRLQDPDQPK
jgi:transcriptional regulator with XRE-family HTH domain